MGSRKKSSKNKRSQKYSRKHKKANFKQYGGSKEYEQKYVSSHMILKSCDVHSNNPSFRTTLDGYDLSKLTEGSTLSMIVTIIPEFVKKIETIPSKVILVSGDCDPTVPDGLFETDEKFKAFIESDKIIHWYSQNYIGTHPKVTGIPIGIDSQAGLEEHIATHQIIPFSKRLIKCYCNFGNSMGQRKYGYDRTDALEKIPSELMYKEPTRISHKDTFINQSKYAFVVSPHGNGLDCHRTWEALVLGCIPIVKTSGIDYLYDELPVLIVKDWADVTKELLESKIKEFENKQFNYDRLLLKYWMDKIKSTNI